MLIVRSFVVIAARTTLLSRLRSHAAVVQANQFHKTGLLFKKRKKQIDVKDLVSRVMNDTPEVIYERKVQKEAEEGEIIEIDSEDSNDNDVEVLEEIMHKTPKNPPSKKFGREIYHPRCPLSGRLLDFTPVGEKVNRHGVGKGEVQFSVMSYNVLAQELLEQHPYLYQYNNPQSLVWQQRFSGIVKEINFLKPDILCIQEVQASHLDRYYTATLKNLGYTGTFKRRTGEKCDGCAIFWLKSKFKLLEETSVEFFQPGVSVLDRDNIAIVLRLEIDGHEVVVATTHLLYNPKRSDIRLAQVQLLLAELDRVSHCKIDGVTCHHPVILTGDFNLDPFSSVYKLITSGQLRYESLSKPRLKEQPGRASPPLGCSLVPPHLGVTDCCRHASIITERTECIERQRSVEIVTRELNLLGLHHTERRSRKMQVPKSGEHQFGSGTLSHNLSLVSAYPHRRNNKFEATTHQDEWTTVDYIFYSQLSEDLSSKRLSLLATWRLPTVDECEILGPIPNFDAPSDHLPIFADFLLV
ncbi:protein angel homolog 2 [Neocloeon triangulifer]|uniref:protein angel homolog 2 n=1 Tax=Neocloeon triangulifer TaxID=2078957 RepID=UPI00286F85BA|nr:protein angel homolog 2 [Neocloeon triangulifer]